MTTVVCDGCGEAQPSTQQEKLPDGGWVLPFDTFGYYGGFDDNIGVLLGEDESRYAKLCHDCVVKFLTMFPRISENMPGGLHPNFVHTDFRAEGNDGTVYPSCCQWAWCWKRTNDSDGRLIRIDTFIGDGRGGWRYLGKTSFPPPSGD